MQEITNKKFFINYAFFTLILVILFAILSYTSIVSRKLFTKNLSYSVQSVLDEYQKDSWKIESEIPINKPISINCAAYTISNKANAITSKAIIIRVVTFYGPLPAVFLYNEDKSVEFAGFASLHGRIGKAANSGYPDKRIEYWSQKIPQILE